MTTKRAILEHLTADELRGIIDHFELWIQDRRARGGLIDAIATSRKADLEPVLTAMARDRLKELCRKLGLDDGGRDKAVIVARLLGHDAVAVQPSLFAATSAVAADASRDVEPITTTPRVRGAKPKGNGTSGGDLGFEAKLWQAADKLRNNMDAAEYKHVVLGLIFLKYISDAFEDLHTRPGRAEDRGRRSRGPR
jgi:type I restriction enzyme M protein